MSVGEYPALRLPRWDGLDGYWAHLREQALPTILPGPLTMEDDLLRAAARLMRGRFLAVGRVRDVRRIIELACGSWIGRPMRMRFPLCARERPYMTDDGAITVSLYFLFSSGGLRVLKVLLHELAHWWLARQRGYDRLLALDREYAERRGTQGENLLLSPIEYLATALSIDLTARLAAAMEGRERDRLLGMAADETQRVKTAIRSLCL